MNSKKNTKKISLTSFFFLTLSFLLAWFVGDTFTDNDYAILFAGPLVVSLTYLISSFFLFFFNDEVVKKWLSYSYKWTVPLFVLFLIVSANVINAGVHENDFISWYSFYIPLLAVSALFVFTTPFYLHKKSKEANNPTNSGEVGKAQ